MTGWKNDLVDLAETAWNRLWSRLDGLTDDEYFWEPAPLCWSVRLTADGLYVADWGVPMSVPAPLTTIAWRLGHIIYILTDPRYAIQLGLELVPTQPEGLPGTAAEALTRLQASYAVTRGYLTEIDEDTLGHEMGSIAGPWAASDRGSFVLHMLDELIHHSAEVGVMRDLYRATNGAEPHIAALLDSEASAARTPSAGAMPDLLLQAAEIGQWAAIPRLVKLGFPIALPDGRSALHYAAGAGALPTVRYLISIGADHQLVDPIFHQTPLGWAEYFQHTPVSDYLRSLQPD